MSAKSITKFVCVVATIAGAVSACSTIKTYSHPGAINDAKTLKSSADGIVYALPKRRIEFAIERKLTKASDVAKKLAGAKSALEAAKKAEANAKKAEAVAKAISENAAGSAKGEAERKYQLAKAASMAASDAKTKAATLVAAAESEAAAATLGPACVAPSYSYSVKLLPPEPDPRYVFRARHIHLIWRDDEATITTTPEGLLSSTKVTSTDRTGDILVEIAKTVSFFLGPTPTLEADGGPPAPDCPTRLTHPAFSIRTVFDPATFAAEAAVAGTGGADSLVDKFDAELTDQLGADVNEQLDGLNAPFRLFVEDGGGASALGVSLLPATGTDSNDGVEKDRSETEGVPGLLYRRALPYKISIYQAFQVNGATETAPVHTAIAFAPNEGPVGIVPYKAGSFVKTAYDVSFDNGMLTSWDANRPAELFAIWRLPLEIVDGVFEGLSKIIPFRIEQTTNENQLLELQAENIELEEKLKSLQKSSGAENPTE